MRIEVDEEVFARAHEIENVVRAKAPDAERDRKLSAPVVEALEKTNLIRMFAPKSLGGLETDPITCARTVEEVARYDTAAAWALQSNSGAYTCALLPEAGAREVLTGEGSDGMIAAAFQPPLAAVETKGGYRLTGRRPYASHASASKWVFFTALVMDDQRPRVVDGRPVVLGAFVRAAECTLHDNWHTLGMRGTDSGDVEVHDLFVPSYRTFFLAPGAEPGPAFRGPLYRFPMLGACVAAMLPPVALAVGREAIDEACRLVVQKTSMGSVKPLRERGVTQLKVGRAEAMLSSARAYLYDTLAAVWELTVAGGRATLEQKATVMLASANAVQTAATVCDAMFGLSGTSAIFSGTRMERIYRDSQVIRQHGFVAEARMENYGQIRLGLESEFAMVAF